MAVSRDVTVKYQTVGADVEEWTLKYVNPNANTTQLYQAINDIWNYSTGTILDVYAVDTYSIKEE